MLKVKSANQKLKAVNVARKQARQGVLDEVEEVLKSAGEQVSGTVPQPDQVRTPQPDQEIGPEEKAKEARQFQALQNELRDVREQAEQSEEKQKLAEEQLKRQKEDEKKEEEGVLVEPTTRPKLGPDLFGRKRKQRTVELPKAPTG